MDSVIDESLLVSKVLKGKEFLELPMNSSFNIESNTFFKKIKKTYLTSKSYFNLTYKKSVNFESVSNLETSTACISHRFLQVLKNSRKNLFFCFSTTHL